MNPRTYNNAIIDIQTAVVDKQTDMIAEMDANDLGQAATVETTYNALNDQIDIALAELEVMKPFNGDPVFRDAVIAYVEWLDTLVDNDYAELLAIFQKNEEDITQDDYDQYNMVIGEISTELDWLQMMINDAQEDFASEHDLELVE